MKVYNEGTFLKHQDLGTQDWPVTILEVERQEIKNKDGSNDKKFVVYFEEIEKGLVLNTTNMNMLYKLFQTDESDEWIGQRITLYVKDDIEYSGDLVSGIRIRSKKPQ